MPPKSFEQQKQFFESHRDSIRQAAESNGAAGVIEFIAGFDDQAPQRILYVFARHVLVMADWKGRNFDDYIQVCDRGIELIGQQADAATDEKTRNDLLHTLHVISYNLATDLAECWPGDDEPRSEAHYLRGVQAGHDCLRWSQQRGAPANAFSIGHWVLGMHQLSLGRTAAARESWGKSLEYAKEDARARGSSTSVDAGGTFSVIGGAGWLGLARWLEGDAAGRDQYETAIAAFKAQRHDPQKNQDADFGIGQLEKIRAKYLGHDGE